MEVDDLLSVAVLERTFDRNPSSIRKPDLCRLGIEADLPNSQSDKKA